MLPECQELRRDCQGEGPVSTGSTTGGGRRRDVVLYVHLSQDALCSGDPAGGVKLHVMALAIIEADGGGRKTLLACNRQRYGTVQPA